MNKKGFSYLIFGILVLLAVSGIVAFIYLKPASNSKTCNYSDLYKKYYSGNQTSPSEGWSFVNIKKDFLGYYPLSFKEGSQILISNETVEGRDNVYIDLGTEENPKSILLLAQRRALYGIPGKEPTFKLWVEQVDPDYYNIYYEQIQNQTESYKRENIDVEKLNYKNYEYYISIRKDLSNNDALKHYSAIGSVYIFNPLLHQVIFINFFNTKWCGGFYGQEFKFYEDEKLVSKSEMQSIVQQIIDSIVG